MAPPAGPHGFDVAGGDELLYPFVDRLPANAKSISQRLLLRPGISLESGQVV
jgi:hypothetical protein